jgi:cytochrome c
MFDRPIKQRNRHIVEYQGDQKIMRILKRLFSGLFAPGTWVCALLTIGLVLNTDNSHASQSLAQKHACMSCHALEKTVVGPSFVAVAQKYRHNPAAPKILLQKTRSGGAGVWGKIPMPPHPQSSEQDLRDIIAWILSLEGPAPGFACERAKGETEQAICAVAALSKLDGELAKAYGDARKSSSDVIRLKQDQMAWLRGERDPCKADRICLEARYRARIAALGQAWSVSNEERLWGDKAPFQPHLLYSVDNRICGLALEAAKSRFLSKTPILQAAPEQAGATDSQGWRWLEWQPIDLPKGVTVGDAYPPSSGLFSIEIAMADKVQPALLVKHSFSHSWRGDNHNAAFFDSPASMRKAMKLATSKGQLDINTLFKLGKPFYPEPSIPLPDSATVLSFNTWQEPRIAEFNRRYFIYDEGNDFSRLSSHHLGLLEIQPDGQLRSLCRIQTLPDAVETYRFLAMPGLRTYFQRLRTIGTGGVGWCGTLNSNTSHDASGEAALKRLGFRPWAVDMSAEGSPYYKWDARTERFLVDWSSEWDAWSQREYLTWQEDFQSARAALAAYYIKSFGLSEGQAGKIAEQTLRQASAAYLQIPQSYEPSTTMGISELADMDEYQQRSAIAIQIKRMLANGAHPARIEEFTKQVTGKPGEKEKARLARMPGPAAAPAPPAGSLCGLGVSVTEKGKVKKLKNGPPCPQPKYVPPPPEVKPTFVLVRKEVEQLLLDSWQLAIPHPQLIEMLLRHGLDVNVANPFGKTMLMYAAQLNRPDVVRLLLKRKAKASMRTIPVGECGMVVKGGRDALSYAAENAGIEVMRLLVEAGADVGAGDAENRSARDYLAANPYLSDDQEKLPIRELVNIKQAIESDKPSFSCEGKLSALEKLICQSPALARRDRELDMAFKAWKTNEVGPEVGDEKLDSQRAWLNRRQNECAGKSTADESESCLQLMTSARIRYLFGRVADAKQARTGL